MKRLMMTTLLTICLCARMAGAASNTTEGTWTFDSGFESAILPNPFVTGDERRFQGDDGIFACGGDGVGELEGTYDSGPTRMMTLTFPPELRIPVLGGVMCNIEWTVALNPGGDRFTGTETYGVADCSPEATQCDSPCEDITAYEIRASRTSTARPPRCDFDDDGTPDRDDNCPFTANDAQEDADGDGLGDACDEFPDESDHEKAQCFLDADGALAELESLQACVANYQKERWSRCWDGRDNDCDGLVDRDDPDCRWWARF